MAKGNLYVVSGPGASGKGTLCKAVVEDARAIIRDATWFDPKLWLSVSATSRYPRAGEVDGVHYFFKTKEVFEKMIEDGEMLEYSIFNDQYYGTPLTYFQEKLENGFDVILEINTDGAAQIKKLHPEVILIFVVAPSMDILKKRMRERMGNEKAIQDGDAAAIAAMETQIAWRTEKAYQELELMPEYDYIIVNDQLLEAVADLRAIIRSQRCIMANNSHILTTLKEGKRI